MDPGVPELVRIPAGPFFMGAEHGDDNERPEHVVSLDPFLIGVSPVTQAEYGVFVQDTGWRPPGVWELPMIIRPAREEEFKRTAAPYWWMADQPPATRGDHPVVLVTFEDAREYCRWLSARTGRPYRLPSEAEWERAARGGLDRRAYPWGDTIDTSRANFLADPQHRANAGTRPARSYPPNGFGLHDMAGNVWNWVADWYRADYYAVSETRNPTGPASGALRLVRGGGWTTEDVGHLRCACRHPVPPETYSYTIGFRVACKD